MSPSYVTYVVLPVPLDIYTLPSLDQFTICHLWQAISNNTMNYSFDLAVLHVLTIQMTLLRTALTALIMLLVFYHAIIPIRRTPGSRYVHTDIARHAENQQRETANTSTYTPSGSPARETLTHINTATPALCLVLDQRFENAPRKTDFGRAKHCQVFDRTHRRPAQLKCTTHPSNPLFPVNVWHLSRELKLYGDMHDSNSSRPRPRALGAIQHCQYQLRSSGGTISASSIPSAAIILPQHGRHSRSPREICSECVLVTAAFKANAYSSSSIFAKTLKGLNLS